MRKKERKIKLAVHGKKKRNAANGGGKFSIKLHGNGGWLTRGVGWMDGWTATARRDAPIVIQIAAARTSVGKSLQ